MGFLFESVTDKLAKVFSVDTSKQRCDSVHLFSNMRHLGRIGLFCSTIKKFLVNLKRHHKDLFEALEQGVDGSVSVQTRRSGFLHGETLRIDADP